MPRDDDEVSLISDISTLLVSDAFLSEDARKTKKHIRHIFKLGLACTLVIFFPISGCIQETILKSYEEKYNVHISAFLAQSIQSISGAFACLYVPAFLALAKPKPSFIIAGCFHLLYTASFALPNAIAIYCISGFLGFAGSLLWTTHGITVIHNSTKKTLSRNYSLFFIIFQISFVISNAYIYVSYGSIDENVNVTMLVMIGLGLLGVIIFPFISTPRPNAGEIAKPKEMILGSVDILKNVNYWMLMPLTIYLGAEVALHLGVFPTAVSSLNALGGNPHQLVGLMGLLTSIGKIVAGISTIFLNDPSKNAFSGMVAHVLAMFLTFLYIPSEAITKDTWKIAYFEPSLPPLAIAAFLYGFGDVAMFTTGFTLLGLLFRGQTFASAVAIFNFITLASSGVLFALSGNLPISVILGACVLILLFGMPFLFRIDRNLKDDARADVDDLFSAEDN